MHLKYSSDDDDSWAENKSCLKGGQCVFSLDILILVKPKLHNLGSRNVIEMCATIESLFSFILMKTHSSIILCMESVMQLLV